MTSASSSTPCLPFRDVENESSYFLPLNPGIYEIRCLRLAPGLWDDPLACCLHHATLDPHVWLQKLSFEALSYCWGDTTDVVSIQLHFLTSSNEGFEASVYLRQGFNITRNLHTALRYLRSHHAPRVLWIDAICINQSDPKEKTTQILMMDHIYSRAEDVIVWLGDDNQASNVFVNKSFYRRFYNDTLLQDILKTRRSANIFRLEKSVRDVATETCLRNPLKRHAALIVARGFVHLVTRPWFKRVWIYQEIFLARPCKYSHGHVGTIVHGHDILSWRQFKGAVMGMQSLQAMLKTPIAPQKHRKDEERLRQTLDWFASSWVRTSSRGRLATFVPSFRETSTFLASHPRDKMLALLHLSNDIQNSQLWAPRLPTLDHCTAFCATDEAHLVTPMPLHARVVSTISRAYGATLATPAIGNVTINVSDVFNHVVSEVETLTSRAAGEAFHRVCWSYYNPHRRIIGTLVSTRPGTAS